MYVPTGGRDVVPGGKVRVRSVTRDSDGVLAVAIYIYIYIHIYIYIYMGFVGGVLLRC